MSGLRKHYKAGIGFLANFEPTLKYTQDDMEIKRALGISTNAKPAFEIEAPKRSVSTMEKHGDNQPDEFTKKAFSKCGYIRKPKETVPVVHKGSGTLRLLETSPSYGTHLLETYYGKMLNDDPTSNLASTMTRQRSGGARSKLNTYSRQGMSDDSPSKLKTSPFVNPLGTGFSSVGD